MSAYDYRITVDMLESTGEGGLHSLSFFTSNRSDIFAVASNLRRRSGLSACEATKLALGLNLIGQVMSKGRDSELCCALLAEA